MAHTPLGKVEQAMILAFRYASPEEQAEFLGLANRSLSEAVEALRESHPDYASLITEECVARVLAALRDGAFSTSGNGPPVLRIDACASCGRGGNLVACAGCCKPFCPLCVRYSADYKRAYCSSCFPGYGGIPAPPVPPSFCPSPGAQASHPHKRGASMGLLQSIGDFVIWAASGGSFSSEHSSQPWYYRVGYPEEQVRVMDALSRFPGYTDEQLNKDVFDGQMTIAGVHQWREKAESALASRRSRGSGAQPHETRIDGSPITGPLTTSDMTQEQLRARRIRRIEAAKVARPVHESIMLFLLKIWLLVGPPAFVFLTVFEVSYIFSAFLPPGDMGGTIIFYGALFVDLAMMFTTFGVAIKRRDLAEKREVQAVTKREELEVWFGTFLWLVFAAINITGQSAFLLHIVQSGPHPGGSTLVYLFIAARVVGFILGDACTAFFLAKVDSSHLRLIARSEREKGQIYADIADAEGKRQVAEAEAEAKILLIQLEVQQKQEDAQFLAAIKRKAFASALGDTPAAPSEPTRARVYRGNT